MQRVQRIGQCDARTHACTHIEGRQTRIWNGWSRGTDGNYGNCTPSAVSAARVWVWVDPITTCLARWEVTRFFQIRSLAALERWLPPSSPPASAAGSIFYARVLIFDDVIIALATTTLKSKAFWIQSEAVSLTRESYNNLPCIATCSPSAVWCFSFEIPS